MNYPSRFIFLIASALPLLSLSAESPVFDRQGLDAAVSAEMPGTMALLVARGGELIYERYGAQGGPESPMPVLQPSNLIVATIYGAGCAAGLLPPVDTKIEAAVGRTRGSDPRFHEETIRNFLTMTAGLATFNFPFWEGDPLQMIYRRKMLLGPGEAWNPEYEDAQVVLHLIGKLSGLPVQEAAGRLVFDPLAISSYLWNKDPLGAYDLLSPVSMLPRDFLKFGQLYIDGGQWEGKRILDAEWAKEATATQVAVPVAKRGVQSISGMGYYWWIVDRPGLKGYAATSEGGQLADSPQSILLVVPKAKAVLLFWNYESARTGATLDDWLEFLERNVVARLP